MKGDIAGGANLVSLACIVTPLNYLAIVGHGHDCAFRPRAGTLSLDNRNEFALLSSCEPFDFGSELRSQYCSCFPVELQPPLAA
jgi:hypothetical protein